MKFSGYDYKARKKKVEQILDNTDEVNEVEKFPRDADFTYTNGYKAMASAIFVDLRDSTALFSKEDYDVEISKVIRGFTSEIIEILRKDTDDTDLKEIGIRGDCVYAVYSTPYTNDIYDISMRAFYINTYMTMLNKLLAKRNLPTIKAGIGLATNKTLAVKAGRKSSGIHNLVWIGDSVAKASKLSDLGNKNGVGSIVMSPTFDYNYSTEASEKEKSFWTKKTDSVYGTYYHSNIIISAFNDWISDGMKE